MAAAAGLRSLLGDGRVREAGLADAVDGVRPALVVRPDTVEAVSGVLALTSCHGWRVAARGGGTSLALGNPPERLDVVMDLGDLDRVLEHAAGDLVVSVEAGVRLATLQAALAGAGQMLALDPPHAAGATVGGVVAANASGPRRLRYGTARDLLIGVTVVLADGTVAKAGGTVVKNVAGYDLSKLMTGSLGTLAVLVRAVFRLHPLPRATRLVEAAVATPESVESAVQRLLHSALVPSAVQLSWPAEAPGRVGVLIEGVEPSVAAQAAAAAALLAAPAMVSGGEAAAARWAALVPGPVPEGGVEVRVTCLPARLASTIAAVRAAAARHASEGWHLTGSLATGILDVRLGAGASPQGVAEMVAALRGRAEPGHVLVRAAPPEVKRGLDVWGPAGDALGLMRRVKERFDSNRILNPGRFVGGI